MKKQSKNGYKYENRIEEVLLSCGYVKIPAKTFTEGTKLSKPVFSRQVKAGSTVFKRQWRIDFLLYHPKRWPKCLGIESKYQGTTGTAEDKIVKTCKDIESNSYQTLLVLGGSGFSHGVFTYLDEEIQRNSNLIGIAAVENIKDYLSN